MPLVLRFCFCVSECEGHHECRWFTIKIAAQYPLRIRGVRYIHTWRTHAAHGLSTQGATLGLSGLLVSRGVLLKRTRRVFCSSPVGIVSGV